MVMERIRGIPIDDMAALNAAKVNIPKLAANGVEIFFTQVFRDNFFHADMHPGNIFVDASTPENPRYCAVDFGIVGSLDERDSRYLAENFLAFFDRDYYRVAKLHVDSGWVPAGTRVDELESAVRTVCEPIFSKPLKEISFGQVLLQLISVARRFDMEVQPQLILLQKTLVQIEGLGRVLYPDLDIWQTGKPVLKAWMIEQTGPRPPSGACGGVAGSALRPGEVALGRPEAGGRGPGRQASGQRRHGGRVLRIGRRPPQPGPARGYGRGSPTGQRGRVAGAGHAPQLGGLGGPAAWAC